MFVNYQSTQHFSTEIKEDIDLFASQAAEAIRNVRTFRENQALREISEAVTGATLNLEHMLNLVLEQALALVGFSNGWISLIDDTGKLLR